MGKEGEEQEQEGRKEGRKSERRGRRQRRDEGMKEGGGDRQCRYITVCTCDIMNDQR